MKDNVDDEGERKKALAAVLEKPENQTCVDCGNIYPRWVSILVPYPNGPFSEPIACLCCQACVGIHRKLGTHVLFVRSVDHDELKSRDIAALQRGGNAKVLEIYEAKLFDKRRQEWNRDQFITLKYRDRMWVAEAKQIELTTERLLSSGGNDMSPASSFDYSFAPAESTFTDFLDLDRPTTIVTDKSFFDPIPIQKDHNNNNPFESDTFLL